MEKKLADYRAKKARQEKLNELKDKTSKFFSNFWQKREESIKQILLPSQEDEIIETEDASSVCSDDNDCVGCSWIDFFYYLLWFILWVILYTVFIKFQFGTVFLIVSALFFMYKNTRTGPKRKGEVSAYSVFNKNCESIDGTLKAEQFEKEIRYGPSVVN